jgi:hypothetical protein
MIDFKKYFIVGTNSDGLQDTMNGIVTGELIRCKECRHLVRYSGALVCSEPNGMMTFSPDGFCSYGQRRKEERR